VTQQPYGDILPIGRGLVGGLGLAASATCTPGAARRCSSGPWSRRQPSPAKESRPQWRLVYRWLDVRGTLAIPAAAADSSELCGRRLRPVFALLDLRRERRHASGSDAVRALIERW